MPDPAAAQRAAAGLAVRAIAEQASLALPAPWSVAVGAAARSRLADLPDALDRAVAATDLGLGHRPVWWRVVGVLQWLVTVIAAVGLGWLLVGYAVRALGLPALGYPMVGLTPAPTLLLLGGLLVGLLVALGVNPVLNWAARRASQRAERRLRAAVAEVGHGYVVDPVQAVLRSADQARAALAAAKSSR